MDEVRLKTQAEVTREVDFSAAAGSIEGLPVGLLSGWRQLSRDAGADGVGGVRARQFINCADGGTDKQGHMGEVAKDVLRSSGEGVRGGGYRNREAVARRDDPGENQRSELCGDGSAQ